MFYVNFKLKFRINKDSLKEISNLFINLNDVDFFNGIE